MKTDPISAAVAYRMALDTISKAGSLATAVRIAQRALETTFNRPEEAQIAVNSGYGHATKQPFVTFTLANPSESANPTIQLTSAEARKQAHYILEAADAAESDGFLIEWLRGSNSAEISDGQLGALLSDFRAYREKLRGEANAE